MGAFDLIEAVYKGIIMIRNMLNASLKARIFTEYLLIMIWGIFFLCMHGSVMIIVPSLIWAALSYILHKVEGKMDVKAYAISTVLAITTLVIIEKLFGTSELKPMYKMLLYPLLLIDPTSLF